MPAFVLRYRDFRRQVREDFRGAIAGLMENEQVQKLDACPQHFKFTRLRHCMDVAYFSYFIARLLDWDAAAVARAGLLHDLFFHAPGQKSHSLLFSHPGIALENARKICVLSPLEEDIILKHMWLLTWDLPRYRESFLVTFVDKFCATREFAASLFCRAEVLRVYGS